MRIVPSVKTFRMKIAINLEWRILASSMSKTMDLNVFSVFPYVKKKMNFVDFRMLNDSRQVYECEMVRNYSLTLVICIKNSSYSNQYIPKQIVVRTKPTHTEH